MLAQVTRMGLQHILHGAYSPRSKNPSRSAAQGSADSDALRSRYVARMLHATGFDFGAGGRGEAGGR